MTRPKGRPTKRPRAIARFLLAVMRKENAVINRAELREETGFPLNQIDNIARDLEQQGILIRKDGQLSVSADETAASLAIGYMFRAEGLDFSMFFHHRQPPAIPEGTVFPTRHLGAFLPEMVWSAWAWRLLDQDHFFRDRLAMLFARAFAANKPGWPEDFILMPELPLALKEANPVASSADLLAMKPGLLNRIMTTATAKWRRSVEIALKVSPQFYLHSFNSLPYGGIRFDGTTVRLTEKSGDNIIPQEYWSDPNRIGQHVHPVCVLTMVLAQKCIALDHPRYNQTRRLLTELDPNWDPRLPVLSEDGKPLEIGSF